MKRLQFPTLQPCVVALINTYDPALAEQTLLEVVVHRMPPQDLALPIAWGYSLAASRSVARG